MAQECTREEAERIARDLFGMEAAATRLASYLDQNFLLRTRSGDAYVLKIANADQEEPALEFECAAMDWVAEHVDFCPRVVSAPSGERIVNVRLADGSNRLARVLTWLEGTLWADLEGIGPGLLRSLGETLARLALAFEGFEHAEMRRDFGWDLQRAEWLCGATAEIGDPERRALVERFMLQYLAYARPRLADLRKGVLHNDANDHNLLVEGGRVTGLIDFGDIVHAPTICDLAIGIAYAILGAADPLAVAADVCAGYHAVRPLEETELEVLFPLVGARLCTSVVQSARAGRADLENEYIRVSEAPAWAALEVLESLHPLEVEERLRAACGYATQAERPSKFPVLAPEDLMSERRKRLGPSLSLSYDEPLKIVRGERQYLFDEGGRGFLDCVNNVCHVGHCHPRVVAAAAEQMALLNTNTRYLHDNIVEYARRLAGTLPDPLSVCFFVNSGSEANDLALRLARTYTKRRDVLVIDGAYHGHLTPLIDMSPYKHDGPGGSGAPDWVHPVRMPDPYRGPFRAGRDSDLAARYTESVRETLASLSGPGPAAFFCESILGCGGQVVLPEGYLAAAFELVRAAGGVCVADEVQTGFGRVGSCMWAFETQGVVPDIVTLGKPIGNGHPLAAVVTTPAIAEEFANGMEYFNTFGGNPVSCAVGLAVLDVLEDEDLQANARRMGEHLLAGFERLQERHPEIGDVRGLGLFVGVQLVRDTETREPAAELLRGVVEGMRTDGILTSIDGPLHDVLKLKPPLCFSEADAELVLSSFDRHLTRLAR